MTRSVRDAVIASLEGDLVGSVFKSYSAADQERYAVVFIARSSKRRDRYMSGQFRDVFTVTVHSVAQSEDQCLWVEERVNKLTGKRLTVPGRRSWPVEFITGQAPQLDDDGAAPLWWSVSQFDIVSDPVEEVT